MGDFTSVNAQALQQGVADLKQAQTKVRSDLDELQSELGGSLSQWSGAAQEAYQVVQQKWNQACDHMAQVIEVMSTTMSQIGANYDSNERSVQGQWG